MKYDILVEDKLPALVEVVQQYCDRGWQPQGGVSMRDEGQDHYLYIQAVVKE